VLVHELLVCFSFVVFLWGSAVFCSSVSVVSICFAFCMLFYWCLVCFPFIALWSNGYYTKFPFCIFSLRLILLCNQYHCVIFILYINWWYTCILFYLVPSLLDLFCCYLCVVAAGYQELHSYPSIIIDRYLNLSVVFLTSITGPRIARKLGCMIVFSSLNITRKF
jgi:hypothetical protein